ncbi:MAG: choice-of-anchor D domain-containing protein [Anaeromyxobacteraceae bacterium]
MKNVVDGFLRALALAALVAAPLRAMPFPSYYDSNCAACHGTTTAGGVQTCAGCHAHGTHPDSNKSSIDLTGTTGKASYAPGETVTVTVNGGYRSGWVRVLLYDQNLQQVARSGGTALPGFTAPCCGPGFPVTLSAPAPTTPGTYTWWVAWYGNQFDAGGAAFGANWIPSANGGHGEERVRTNSFTVVSPANPVIALTPPSLSFGTVNTGATSALPVSVRNTGTATLTVSAVTRCPATSAEFTWSPAAPFTVAPGQAATLTVTYSPTDANTDLGCLTLASNDPANATVNLGLSGTGATPAAPAIALSPGSLDFGAVTVGSSATLPAQVQDTGTAPLTVSAITPCAGTSAEFTWSPPAPFTVAAGGSTTLSVSYAPTAASADSGCLTLASDDPARPTVNLTVAGNGAAVTAPAIAFSPATLDFGTVTIGNTQQRTAQVQNAGTATLTVTAVAACSGAGPEFTWDAATPFSVAPGQSAPVTVTYTPVDTDFHSACLAFSSNDPANPVANLGLTAQGASTPVPAVALSPASLDFMAVEVGKSSTLTSQVQDTGGATLTVSAIAACNGTSAEFTWSPQAPFTVGAGQSQALAVTYAPTDAGADNGCLALTTDDPLHPTVNLALAGSGTVTPAFPVIALDPASLDFGTVTVAGSARRTAQVRNTGTVPLDVLGIAACDGTSPEYTWSPPAPFSVAPGQAATLAVTYSPVDTGTDTGCLAIASNDPTNASVDLQLRGTGASAPVAGVDIDIDELKVPERMERGRVTTIVPRLHAKNAGQVDGSAPARLVALLGGATVYDRSIVVTLPKGEDGTFPFPSLTVPATASGTIAWTVTIADGDPDVDRATARTRIGRGEGGDHEDDDGPVAGAPGSSGPTGATGTTGADASATAGVTKAGMTGGCSTGGTPQAGVLLLLAALLAAGAPGRRTR